MMLINWTRLPSLTALRAFEAAAQAKSFSRAAQSLNVTHSAVAQQVKALEDFLDCKLLTRSPSGVEPSAEGRALASRLQEGFACIVEGVDAVRERGATRPLRITTTAFFAESVVFPRISEFWAENRGTEISFTPSDEMIDIVSDGYDLAVRAGKGGWSGLDTKPLVNSPTVACAAAHLVDDRSTNWDALPWLLPMDSLWEREALEQSGIDPDAARTLDLGDPALEISACEEGLGLILESEIDVRPKLSAGTLKVAPIQINHVSSYFTVAPPWPPRATVRRFRSWLEGICREL